MIRVQLQHQEPCRNVRRTKQYGLSIQTAPSISRAARAGIRIVVRQQTEPLTSFVLHPSIPNCRYCPTNPPLEYKQHKSNTATMNGTTQASTDSLFPASLISPAVAAALPEAYTIRPLQRGDYAAGFLDVLRVLTTVGEVPQADFEARFDEMKQTGGSGAVGTHVLVILDGEGKVVGTGALLVERKLYVLAPYLWLR